MEMCHNTLKNLKRLFQSNTSTIFISTPWWFDAIKHSTLSNAVKKQQSEFIIQNHCFKNTRLGIKKYILFRTNNTQTYNELKCVENVQCQLWQIQIHDYAIILNKSKMNLIWIFMSVYDCFIYMQGKIWFECYANCF